MRQLYDDEVCITTVVVRGSGGPLQAERQHRFVSQALLGQPPRGARIRQAPRFPRVLYLVLAVLLLAGAVFFFSLAFK